MVLLTAACAIKGHRRGLRLEVHSLLILLHRVAELRNAGVSHPRGAVVRPESAHSSQMSDPEPAGLGHEH